MSPSSTITGTGSTPSMQVSVYPMQPRLRGKVCLVTGATGGIGLATVQRFVEEGAAAVVLTDMSQEKLDECVQQLKEFKINILKSSSTHLLGVRMDVTREDQVEAAFATTIERYGKVDVVVANAGIGAPTQPIDETPLELFEKMLQVHVVGVWLTTKYAAKHMKAGIRSSKKTGASIIINSSVAALFGAPDFSPYIASKWGARGVGMAAAVELAPMKIRVNNVHPSLVRTPLLDDCWTPEQARHIQSTIGLGRAAEPIEVANVIVFLASDESSFMAASTVGAHGAHVAT